MLADSFTELVTFLGELTGHIINGGAITHGQAQRILALHAHEELLQLLSHATRLRKYFKGETVGLCAVVNARSGRCSEDCIFCAQSKHHKTDVRIYPLT